MPRKRKRRTTRMDIINEGQLPETLENLRLRLSSPRLRAIGTIKTYLETAARFISEADNKSPSDNDLRRYFVARRQNGISERTLKKEFYHLKKLCQANQWHWPFEKEDTPYTDEQAQVIALEIHVIEQLIAARKELTDNEQFYLALSTTYGCRREELARVSRRDISDGTILIRTAKHGRQVRHLIPPELTDMFEGCHPKKHEPEALSEIFRRICDKAEVKRDKGWGWHSIRRTLRTVAEWALAKDKIPLSIWADYQGWAPVTKGNVYGGAAMMGVYSHPEIMSNDPFYIDKLIYPVHPFLPLWAKDGSTKRHRKKTKA